MKDRLENIPLELRERNQWVVWRLEEREDRRTKVPYNAVTLKHASTTDSNTWSSFDQAVKTWQRLKGAASPSARIDGIGFVFTPDDPYCGIDLDSCRDADTGAVDPDMVAIRDALDSYTEVTPSGRGLHIIIMARLPEGERRRRGPVEMYDTGRFFTMTGDGSGVVADRQAEAMALHEQIFGPRHSTNRPRERTATSPRESDDRRLLDKARRAHNGTKFVRLYDQGDTSGYGHDHSRADAALCCLLLWWTQGDEGRAGRLFEASSLYRKEKAESSRGYVNRTLKNALRQLAGHDYGQASNLSAKETLRR